MEQMKYSILDGDRVIMFLDAEIGIDEYGNGIDGALFMRELMYIDSLNFCDIEIIINSPGGDVVQGMQIYHAIRAAKTKTRTHCVGLAASIAAIILQAGDVREVNDFSVIMFHNPAGGSSKSLGIFREALLAMVARSGLSEKNISKMMDAETWINGNDEKYLNVLWDKVFETEKVIFSEVKDLVAIQNSAVQIINNEKEKIMDNKIKEALNLTPESTVEEVLNAIEGLKVKNELEITVTEEEKKEELNYFILKDGNKLGCENYHLVSGINVKLFDAEGNEIEITPATYELMDETYTYTKSTNLVIGDGGLITEVVENETRTNVMNEVNINIDSLVEKVEITNVEDIKVDEIKETIENVLVEAVKDAVIETEKVDSKLEEEKVEDKIETIEDKAGIDLTSKTVVNNFNSNTMVAMMSKINNKNKNNN